MNLAKTIVIGVLIGGLSFDSTFGYGWSASDPSDFGLKLSSRLGQITQEDLGLHGAQKPEFIVIQNLHTNRSVQFAISSILKTLDREGLLPSRIGAEGLVGPYSVASLQSYPSAFLRKQASDYLVSQGEMPGVLHYLVTSGQRSVYGLETADLYQAGIDLFRKSYASRIALLGQLQKLNAALSVDHQSDASEERAKTLNSDIQTLSDLVQLKVTSRDFPQDVNAARVALAHLQAIWPEKINSDSFAPISAGVDFYSLALMRDEAMFNQAIQLRSMDHQSTTVLVAGGFHTDGITRRLKQAGYSFAVITPSIKHHDAVDDDLYVERMLGIHLSSDQVQEGLDWAGQRLWEPPLGDLPDLFNSALPEVREGSQNTDISAARKSSQSGLTTLRLITLIGSIYFFINWMGSRSELLYTWGHFRWPKYYHWFIALTPLAIYFIYTWLEWLDENWWKRDPIRLAGGQSFHNLNQETIYLRNQIGVDRIVEVLHWADAYDFRGRYKYAILHIVIPRIYQDVKKPEDFNRDIIVKALLEARATVPPPFVVREYRPAVTTMQDVLSRGSEIELTPAFDGYVWRDEGAGDRSAIDSSLKVLDAADLIPPAKLGEGMNGRTVSDEDLALAPRETISPAPIEVSESNGVKTSSTESGFGLLESLPLIAVSGSAVSYGLHIMDAKMIYSFLSLQVPAINLSGAGTASLLVFVSASTIGLGAISYHMYKSRSDRRKALKQQISDLANTLEPRLKNALPIPDFKKDPFSWWDFSLFKPAISQKLIDVRSQILIKASA